MSTFKEAVIVPLALFKTASFSKQLAPGIFNLPVDQRLKLMQAERYYESTEKAKDSQSQGKDKSTELMKESVKSIVDSLEEKDHPVVRSILAKLIEPQSSIKWNPSYEVIIHGRTFPGSDLRELLKYVLDYKVITSSKDLPQAHEEFSQEILKLVPRVWLKIPRRKAARRAGTRLRQIGAQRVAKVARTTQPWITFTGQSRGDKDSEGDSEEDDYLTP